MSNNSLIPDIDYYINSDGDLIFTENYHLKRGFCCKSGCVHCPYGHKEKIDPNVPAEFRDMWGEKDFDPSSEEEE